MNSLIERFDHLSLEDIDVESHYTLSSNINDGFPLDAALESVIDSTMFAGFAVNDNAIKDLTTLLRSAHEEKDSNKLRLLASTFSSYLVKTKMEQTSMYNSVNYLLKAVASSVAQGSEQSRIFDIKKIPENTRLRFFVFMIN